MGITEVQTVPIDTNGHGSLGYMIVVHTDANITRLGRRQRIAIPVLWRMPSCICRWLEKPPWKSSSSGGLARYGPA